MEDVEGFVRVRLENDTNWETYYKEYGYNEDVIKEFCRAHPEWYLQKIKTDEYCELCIEVEELDTKELKSYQVYIDNAGNFLIQEVLNEEREEK